MVEHEKSQKPQTVTIKREVLRAHLALVNAKLTPEPESRLIETEALTVDNLRHLSSEIRETLSQGGTLVVTQDRFAYILSARRKFSIFVPSTYNVDWQQKFMEVPIIFGRPKLDSINSTDNLKSISLNMTTPAEIYSINLKLDDPENPAAIYKITRDLKPHFVFLQKDNNRFLVPVAKKLKKAA